MRKIQGLCICLFPVHFPVLEAFVGKDNVDTRCNAFSILKIVVAFKYGTQKSNA